MANVRYRFTSDPTFHNDFLGSIFFEHGVCEFDENDSEKIRFLERMRVVNGWVFDKIEDEVPPQEAAIIKEVAEIIKEAAPKKSSSKRKSRKKKKKKKTATKPSPKTTTAELEIKSKEQMLIPDTTPDSPPKDEMIPPPGTNFDLNRKGRGPSEFTEEKIEQTENQPEHDDTGRSGDTGKDDSVSKADS